VNYHDFVGQVHHRAEMASEQEAVSAIRATLETLAERVTKGEATDVAAQLPEELGRYMQQAAKDQPDRFDLQEFFTRTAVREGVDLPVSTYHARVVVEVLDEAITADEMADLRSQLPDTYAPLFEAGSEGDMDTG
jgi:uncharacterized protein (DUF2267 family)